MASHCEKLLSTSLFHFRTLQHVALGLFHMRERERGRGRPAAGRTDEMGGCPCRRTPHVGDRSSNHLDEEARGV